MLKKGIFVLYTLLICSFLVLANPYSSNLYEEEITFNTSDLANLTLLNDTYVPYTGAFKLVDLGSQGLITEGAISGGLYYTGTLGLETGPSSASGYFVHTPTNNAVYLAGQHLGKMYAIRSVGDILMTSSMVNITNTTGLAQLCLNGNCLTDLNLSSNYVPYNGANQNVNLGSANLTTTNGFIHTEYSGGGNDWRFTGSFYNPAIGGIAGAFDNAGDLAVWLASDTTFYGKWSLYVPYGNVYFDDNLTIDTNTFHVDSDNNRVGIGTTSPTHALNIVGKTNLTDDLLIHSAMYFNTTSEALYIGDTFGNPTSQLTIVNELNAGGGATKGRTRGIDVRNHFNGVGGNLIYMTRSRGTFASPTKPNDNDLLGAFWGSVYNGTNYNNVVGWGWTITNTTSGNNIMTDLEFINAPAGTNSFSTATSLMIIKSNGNVGFGTTTPTHKINAIGDANITGAIYGNDYYGGSGSQGITDSSSYWLCTASDCSTSCQVSIEDGLIVGCT